MPCGVVRFFLKGRCPRERRVDRWRNGTIFRLLLPGTGRPTIVHIRVPGEHNVTNALAAQPSGLSWAYLAHDRAGSRTIPSCCHAFTGDHHQGVKIINDCYNANPASMKAAVQSSRIGHSHARVAVLGDMLELGRRPCLCIGRLEILAALKSPD